MKRAAEIRLIQNNPADKHYWDVLVNGWCIGYVTGNTDIRACITGIQFGQIQPFEQEQFSTVEDAKEALVQCFKGAIRNGD